jgi:hypothetical protein
VLQVLALKTAEEALKDAEYLNGHDRKRQRTEPSVPGLGMSDDEDEVSHPACCLPGSWRPCRAIISPNAKVSAKLTLHPPLAFCFTLCRGHILANARAEIHNTQKATSKVASSVETHCGLAQVSLLYRTETQMMMPASSGASKYHLQVADSLPSIGIMHSMTTGQADSLLPDHPLAAVALHSDQAAACPWILACILSQRI